MRASRTRTFRTNASAKAMAVRRLPRALTDGRLYDFFTLVSQILHTYGRGSAYVEIDRWDGAACEECGDTMDEDDRYFCQHCDSTLCSSCAVSCNACQNSYCSECRRSCAACGEDYCSSCLAVCRQCRKRFCNNCLVEGLCPSCYSHTHEEDQGDDSRDDPQCEEPCLVGQTQENLQRHKPPQGLRLSPTAWAKLLYLRDASDSEVGGFGISAADDLLYIDDVALVRQNCDLASGDAPRSGGGGLF